MKRNENKYSLPGRTSMMDGNEQLYFSGTAYLGLQVLPSFVDLVKDGLDRYGTVYGGSRRANTAIDIFDRCESYLTEWFGSEAALITTSGSLAGKLIADHISQYRNVLFAPDLHPASLHHQVVLPEADLGEWVYGLQQRLENMDGSPAHIVLNSINPLTADMVPVERLASLDYQGEIILYIDDSHGIGLLGRRGRGIREEGKWPVHISLVTYGSFAKALGIQAGWIEGDYQHLFAIRNSPLFGGSSPPAPAFIYAFMNSDSLIKQQREQLTRNLTFFANDPISRRFHFQPRFPVIPTDQHALARFLELQRIRISHFPYPTSTDRLFTRIVINSLHRKEDINKLVFHLKRFFSQND